MNAPANPNPLFATFCAAIDQFSVQKFSNNLALATQKKYTELHLSFQSTGGIVGDGIFLYSLIKASPIPVTIYNIGSVQSIATVAFLGASRRVVNKHALFMIHRTTFTPQSATGELLRELSVVADLEDKRTEALLRDRVVLHDGKDWNNMKDNSLWFTAKESVDAGIADSIGDFSPPKGCELWSFIL